MTAVAAATSNLVRLIISEHHLTNAPEVPVSPHAPCFTAKEPSELSAMEVNSPEPRAQPSAQTGGSAGVKPGVGVCRKAETSRHLLSLQSGVQEPYPAAPE